MATIEVGRDGQLDSVLESSENIVVVLDGIGKIVRISRGVRNILGYDDQDLAGTSIMTIVPVDRRDWMSAISKRAREDGVVPDVFVHWRTKDGRRLITKSTLKSVVNYQHDVVGIIISEDVTAPKPHEGAMTPQQAIQLIQASEIAIIVTDLSGNIISFSSGAEKLTGFSSSNVIGSNVGRIFINRSVIGDITTRGLRDGKVEDSETSIIMADESKKEVSVSLSVQRNPSGAAMGFSLVMFDITKRKELERELELRAEKLKLVNELTARIRSGKSLRDIYKVAVDGLKRMVNFDSMTLIITTKSDNGFKITSFEGKRPDWMSSELKIPIDKGPFAKAMSSRKPVVYTPSELEESLSIAIPNDSFKVGLAVPLYAGERDLGILNLTSTSSSAFGNKEIDLVVLVSDHIALAAESTRLLTALMENINIQTTLIETSTAVRSEINLEGAYKASVSKAQEIVSSNQVALYMQESGQLKIFASESPGKITFPETISKDNKSLASAYFFGNGKPFIKDVLQSDDASDQEKKDFGSVVMSKIISRTGPTGLLLAARKKGGTPFSAYEFELMNLFSNHLSPSLENAQLFEDTRKSEKLARQALESERRTEEALHFLLDMFAHDLQNQIQGILGYLELVGNSDLPAEVRVYLDKAIRQVRAGSYLASGTAQVFKNIEIERTTKTEDVILFALKEALHRFSMVFPNIEIESIIPEIIEEKKSMDPLLTELFFHVLRLMYGATRSKSIAVEMLQREEQHTIAIEFRAEKSLSSEKILKSFEDDEITNQMDPFLVRLLGEIYGAILKTSERLDPEGNTESVFTLEFEVSKLA